MVRTHMYIETLNSIDFTKRINRFLGQIRSGLQVHPDGEHLIFPLGNKVSIKHLESGKQSFLCGHTCTISNIDVSKS